MREAVWVMFCHRALTDSSLHLELHPVGNESWCRYQSAKARERNTLEMLTAHPVLDAVKFIYKGIINGIPLHLGHFRSFVKPCA